MTESRSIGITLSTVLILSVITAGSVSAQREDPEIVIDRLLRPFDSTDPGRAGRSFLIDRLERGTTLWLTEAIAFVDRQTGGGWLHPEERLLLYLLTEDTRLHSPDTLRTLLQEKYSDSGPGDERLLRLGRTAVRQSERSLLRFLSSGGLDETGARFLLLLYQSLTLQSIRSVDELDDRIDRFVEANRTDERAALADRYFRRRIDAGTIGLGLVAGYDAGRFVKADVAAHGPRIGLLVQIVDFNIEVAGLARSIDSFGAQSTSIEGTMRLGYDLTKGTSVILPFAGLHHWSVGEGDYRLTTPLLGIDLGTYLLFDDPPHLRLSIGGEWHFPSLSDGSTLHESHFWSLRFSLALSNRSYRIR